MLKLKVRTGNLKSQALWLKQIRKLLIIILGLSHHRTARLAKMAQGKIVLVNQAKESQS